jgi:D-threo-aldose 1-dehydrogenase
MDPFSLKRLGMTDVKLPRLGFGGAGLGHVFTTITDDEAAATLRAAWDAGVRYYDTSPWYGRGLSERRIGRELCFKPRSDVIVSTKVGRLLRAPADVAAFERSERAWSTGLKFQHHFDYTYDGVRRSYDDSLQRLGMNRIDLLIIHDLDRTSFQSDDLVRAYLNQLATGGMRALSDLKAQGLIGAIGAGVNRLGTIGPFLDMLDLDFFVVALPYTLAEQPALDREFPLCFERGVGIVIGAPLASGILATGPAPGAKLNYRDPTPEEADRIRRMDVVCKSYGVPLSAAALQFPLHHPLVAAIIPGAYAPVHPIRNVEAVRIDIPDALWASLKDEGLLRRDAPTPGGTA